MNRHIERLIYVKKIKKDIEQSPFASDLFKHLWEESWTYIKTVVDVVHEPVLILDKDLRVMAANEPFYRTFQVNPKETENEIVYKLGNGQWNIPSLKKLLEDILPKNTFFKGYEVSHDFPVIGHKAMMLNARQMHFKQTNVNNSRLFPSIILLAMEDITEMMDVAQLLAVHTKEFQNNLITKTDKLEGHIAKLEEELKKLQQK